MQRLICPVCGRADITLRTDGALSNHRDGSADPCIGSRHAPVPANVPPVDDLLALVDCDTPEDYE